MTTDTRLRRGKEDEGVKLRRHGADAKLSKALGVANNQDFKAFFDEFHSDALSALENAILDGSERSEREALHRVYEFQAVMKLKRKIFGPIVASVKAAKKEEVRKANEWDGRSRRL